MNVQHNKVMNKVTDKAKRKIKKTRKKKKKKLNEMSIVERVKMKQTGEEKLYNEKEKFVNFMKMAELTGLGLF